MLFLSLCLHLLNKQFSNTTSPKITTNGPSVIFYLHSEGKSSEVSIIQNRNPEKLIFKDAICPMLRLKCLLLADLLSCVLTSSQKSPKLFKPRETCKFMQLTLIPPIISLTLQSCDVGSWSCQFGKWFLRLGCVHVFWGGKVGTSWTL